MPSSSKARRFMLADEAAPCSIVAAYHRLKKCDKAVTAARGQYAICWQEKEDADI
jgi:hypothetical protein